MNRNPWRSRIRLLAFIDAAAGAATALGGVAVALGISGDLGAYEAAVAAGVALAVDVVAVMSNAGIVTNGEAETTPVDSPLGRDGVPLVPVRDI